MVTRLTLTRAFLQGVPRPQGVRRPRLVAPNTPTTTMPPSSGARTDADDRWPGRGPARWRLRRCRTPSRRRGRADDDQGRPRAVHRAAAGGAPGRARLGRPSPELSGRVRLVGSDAARAYPVEWAVAKRRAAPSCRPATVTEVRGCVPEGVGRGVTKRGQVVVAHQVAKQRSSWVPAAVAPPLLPGRGEAGGGRAHVRSSAHGAGRHDDSPANAWFGVPAGAPFGVVGDMSVLDRHPGAVAMPDMARVNLSRGGRSHGTAGLRRASTNPESACAGDR